MVAVPQYHYDALISENKSLKNTVSILQNNANSLRELQNKHDTFMKGIKDREIERQKMIPAIIVEQNKHIADITDNSIETQNIQLEPINLQLDNMREEFEEFKNKILMRESKILFYKFAAAFQEINIKYKLDKSLEHPFNSRHLRRGLMHNVPIDHFHKDYIFERDSELDDTAIVIYDKIQFIRTKLSQLSDDMVISFEKRYGQGLVKEMIMQLDIILQKPKPNGDISEEEKTEYVNWFDI
jgi:hypothetical protein